MGSKRLYKKKHFGKRSCALSLNNESYVGYDSENNPTVCTLIHEKDTYPPISYIQNLQNLKNMYSLKKGNVVCKSVIYNLQISHHFSKNTKMGVTTNQFSKCDKTRIQ